MQLKKISELFYLEKGSLQSTKATPGKYKFITASTVWKTNSNYTHEGEALIIAVAASGSLGRVHYVNDKFISSDLCFIMTPKNPDSLPINLSLYYYILNLIKEDLVYRTATGSAKKAINRKNLGAYEIPYVSVESQPSLADKLKFIDSRKDKLITEVGSQERLIKRLRSLILENAVQGKLTEQWRKTNPSEEDASELLKRIEAEKQQLITEKIIKKEKLLPLIKNEDKPFDLPDSWAWCRMGKVSDIQRGSSPRPKGDPRYFSESKTNNHWISIKDISKHAKKNVLLNTEEYLTDLGTKYSRYVKKNELIVAVSGSTTGKCCLTGIDGYFYDGIAMVRLIGDTIDHDFHLMYYLQQYSQMNDAKFGAAFPNINTKFLSEMMFPFPPLKEQKAIVEKVNSLMALCDELEQQVDNSQTQIEQLMQSCLKEVFV